MRSTEVKKALLDSFVPQIPESKRSMERVGDSRFLPLLEQYQTLLESVDPSQTIIIDYLRDLKTFEDVAEVLTPEEINQFYEATVSLEKRPWYEEVTGLFIDKLIQNSFDAGYNDFAPPPLYYIGGKLRGTEERRLCLILSEEGSWYTSSRAFQVDFKTNNPQLVDRLLRVPAKVHFVLGEELTNNRSIFIHPNGREEILRDYTNMKNLW